MALLSKIKDLIPAPESAYHMELDNVSSSVNCDHAGNPEQGAEYETSGIILLCGSRDAWSEFNVTMASTGITASLNSQTRKISVSAITRDTATVTVTATKKNNASLVLQATYSIHKNKAGAPGEHATSYSLKPTMDVIRKSSTGSVLTSYIEFRVKKVVGASVTMLSTNGQLTQEGLSICTSSGENATSNGSTSNAMPRCSSVGQLFGTDDTVEFLLKKGSTVEDREPIGSTRDGANGQDGEDGQDAVVRYVTCSPASVKSDKDGVPVNGTANITIRQYKRVGTAAATLSNELYIKVCQVRGETETQYAFIKQNAVQVPFVAISGCDSLNVYLCDSSGNTQTAPFNIPNNRQGQNGTDGQDGADGADGKDATQRNLFGKHCTFSSNDVTHYETGFAVMASSSNSFWINNLISQSGKYIVSGYLTHTGGGNVAVQFQGATAKGVPLTANTRKYISLVFDVTYNQSSSYAGGLRITTTAAGTLVADHLKVEDATGRSTDTATEWTDGNGYITPKDNLLLDTRKFHNARNNWSTLRGTTDTVEGGYNVQYATASQEVVIAEQDVTHSLKPNTWYTLSFMAKATTQHDRLFTYIHPSALAGGANVMVYAEGYKTQETDGMVKHTVGTSWKLHYVTFRTASTVTSGKVRWKIIPVTAGQTNYNVQMTKPKLEESQFPTEYRCNSYDLLGPMPLPEGIYDSAKTYVCNAVKTPVVEESGHFYYMNKEGSVTGIAPSQDTSNAYWTMATQFQMVIAEALMANFAKLASSVFYGDWMFSQYGNGGASQNYTLFNPNNPTGGSFAPELALDFRTGRAILNNAKIRGEIEATSGTFNGTVKANLIYARTLDSPEDGYQINPEDEDGGYSSYIYGFTGPERTIYLPDARTYEGIEFTFFRPHLTRTAPGDVQVCPKPDSQDTIRYRGDVLLETTSSYYLPPNKVVKIKSFGSTGWIVMD